MTWSILSLVVCLALAVKLTFFSDFQRSNSRLMYRVPLFLVTIYAGSVVIDFLYHPVPTNPFRALFHLALLVGSFILQPHHLPWNKK